MKDYIDHFKQHLKRQRKSINTIDAYVRAVVKYSDLYEKKFENECFVLHEGNFLSYLHYLKRQRNKKGLLISAKTVNLSMIGSKTFNEFLVEEGKMSSVLICKTMFEKVQNSIASPSKFTKVEVDQFFQSILNNGNDHSNDSYREFTLSKLLALTGLRISEALMLQLEDIHLEAKEIRVRNGKGSKSRTVFINTDLHRILSNYLRNKRTRYRLAEVSPFIFLSRRSRHLYRKTVNKLFNRYSEAAGLIKTITPHDLRHYFCSSALENGLAIHEVANLAGHSSITTTSLYTNPSRQSMMNKLENL